MTEHFLAIIQSKLLTRKDLALYRMELLEDEKNNSAKGFPALFLPGFRRSLDAFVSRVDQATSHQGENVRIVKCDEVAELGSMLTIYRRIAELDPTLNEELGMEGAHWPLSRLIKMEVSSLDCCCGQGTHVEENQDAIMELQDCACEIASFSKSFPLPTTPLSPEELRARLPLVFDIFPIGTEESVKNNIIDQHESVEGGVSILINQVTIRQSAQKDVGFVMWPSAIVLSCWLLSHPEEVHEKRVLELGAGCGLVGLVAAKLQSMRLGCSPSSSQMATSPSTVLLTDFNEVVVDNLVGNLKLNDLHGIAKACKFDFYGGDSAQCGVGSTCGKVNGPFDVILASDVICQPEDAFALAGSIASSLRVGGTAIVVCADSKHRFGVEKFEEACRVAPSLSLSRTVLNDLYGGMLSSMAKTTGFVEGMALTMYRIEKTNGQNIDS